MEPRRIVLELTVLQEETIKALFAHNDWDFKEIQQPKGKSVYYILFTDCQFMSIF